MLTHIIPICHDQYVLRDDRMLDSSNIKIGGEVVQQVRKKLKKTQCYAYDYSGTINTCDTEENVTGICELFGVTYLILRMLFRYLVSSIFNPKQPLES